VGSARHRIMDGRSGFLVENIEQAAVCTETLLSEPIIRLTVSRRAQDRLRHHFLMTRLFKG
jgi:hypothetical protein